MEHIVYTERYNVSPTVVIIIDMKLSQQVWTVRGFIHCKYATMGEFAEIQLPASSLEHALPQARAAVADYLNNFKSLIQAGVTPNA